MPEYVTMCTVTTVLWKAVLTVYLFFCRLTIVVYFAPLKSTDSNYSAAEAAWKRAKQKQIASRHRQELSAEFVRILYLTKAEIVWLLIPNGRFHFAASIPATKKGGGN